MSKRERKKILIIRPSSIGDVVMASPMLTVLKTAYPDAHIAWLLDPGAIDLLRDHPLLDEIMLWDKQKWKDLWKSGRIITLLSDMIRFSKNLRSRNFDLALEAQGLLRSRILAWLSGARERIGFESKEPGDFLMTKVISRGPSNKQMSSEYYHMMKEIGLAPQKPFCPSLAIPEDSVQKARAKLARAGINNRYALLCPFTTRPQKHWFNDRWAALAAELKQRFALSSILMGGPGDQEEGKKIEKLSQGEALNLAGQTTLGEAMAMVKNASLLVGVDTGLTHMGAAFNVPTVALFGATCPYLHTQRTSFAVVYHKLDCSPCKRRPTCQGEFTCMKRITVQEVLDTARKIGERVS
ncbi:MAG: lipopolysaccharide heptosyltransferase II [Deltaproteobacteria bacterium]|nr:lipopolysaccharide heptosyltransferase II [Deltaproteobacteria bacterium]MBW1929070.1 lipopolysaccharide heptosyltransferase II [Deltaproteobacteria bacterium]MBW2025211.1 lipopolysaccharide heptosyltransferase II [Deltaproteobacteria bacterium]MBW2125403.1 lipopolysaccharide heptosyltransferase II [Deltaproteobacteria bacterium]